MHCYKTWNGRSPLNDPKTKDSQTLFYNSDLKGSADSTSRQYHPQTESLIYQGLKTALKIPEKALKQSNGNRGTP